MVWFVLGLVLSVFLIGIMVDGFSLWFDEEVTSFIGLVVQVEMVEVKVMWTVEDAEDDLWWVDKVVVVGSVLFVSVEGG